MAEVINNDKGFKVISLSTEDAASLGFGIDGFRRMYMHAL